MSARAFALCALFLALLSACTERDDMKQGARLKPFEVGQGDPFPLATDVLPLGAIPRDPSPFDPMAQPATSMDLLIRGRVCFDAFCSPCHARDGYGDGIIARHGFPRPPSLHDPAVRARNDEHYFDVATRGLGKMPPYGDRVPTADRWAIVAYIRALQLSQHAPPEAMAAGPQPADGKATP